MQVLLGVAIGLVLTFAVMAVVVSSVMELISALARMRARTLEQGIARMLDDQQTEPAGGILGWLGKRRPTGSAPTTQAVLRHPLVRALSSARAQDRPPSYIDAVTFGTALLGSSFSTASMLANFAEDRATIERTITGLSAGEPGDTVRVAWKDSGKDPAKFIADLLNRSDLGMRAIAAIIGPDSSVASRIGELKDRGDPVAAPLEQAWDSAGGNVETFVSHLARPPLIGSVSAGVNGVKTALDGIRQINPHLGRSLTDLWQRAGNDFTSFRHEIEDWFDREMARVSGWYSRWTQWIMVGVALVLAIALNISAVTIGRALWLDPTIRDKAVAVAQQSSASTSTTTSVSTTSTTAPPQSAPTPTTSCSTSAPNGSAAPSVGVDTLCEIGLPIGWNATAWPGWDWYLALHFLGILAVAIAASFGAPFWFDLLNQIVNLRAAGRPPATAAEQRAKT